MKRPLLCRLGVHDWFLDSAFFTLGDKCGRCSKWKDPAAGAEVEIERAAWADAPDGESHQDTLGRVVQALVEHRRTHG